MGRRRARAMAIHVRASASASYARTLHQLRRKVETTTTAIAESMAAEVVKKCSQKLTRERMVLAKAGEREAGGHEGIATRVVCGLERVQRGRAKGFISESGAVVKVNTTIGEALNRRRGTVGVRGQ